MDSTDHEASNTDGMDESADIESPSINTNLPLVDVLIQRNRFGVVVKRTRPGQFQYTASAAGSHGPYGPASISIVHYGDGEFSLRPQCEHSRAYKRFRVAHPN